MSDSWNMKLVEEVNSLKAQRRQWIYTVQEAIKLLEDTKVQEAYELLKGTMPGGYVKTDD